MAYRSKSPPTLLLNDDDFGNTDSEGASSQETEKGSPNNNNLNTIDENLNDLLKTVSNIDDKQIEEKFGRVIGNPSRVKRQFVRKPGTDLGLPIRLTYYKNDSDDDNSGKSTFTKRFIYEYSSDSDIVLKKILQEVFYHNEFNKVHEECGFNMPKIISYGYVLNSDVPTGFIFYIKTSYVEAKPVTDKYSNLKKDEAKKECARIKERLYEINECLKKKGLYHNDLNNENVMIDDLDNIVLIDLGEAIFYDNTFRDDTKFREINENFCDTINSLSGGNRRGVTHKKKAHYKNRKSTKKYKRSKKYRASKKPKTKKNKSTNSKQSRRSKRSRNSRHRR